LAEVYLELSGGRQPDFELSAQSEKLETPFVKSNTNDPVSRVRPSKLPLRITEEEKAAHAAFVDSLGDRTIWRKVN
jgi:DNA polymerase-3 subunit epsilon